jgi:undecaprenyl-diphosphatase
VSLLNVIILAVVQGLAELLPISSSAHVVVAEKLMGIDPSSPEMTLLLVMLHTGTMFAVILYFWKQWRGAFFQSAPTAKRFALLLFVATVTTGIVGETLIQAVERLWFQKSPSTDVEQLFSHLELISPALALAGVLILIAGLLEKRLMFSTAGDGSGLNVKQAGLIGAVQGLCLPFRGLSRSGATISTGMLAGVAKVRAEEFSFALAVVLTPAVDVREALRLIRSEHISSSTDFASAVIPDVIGAFCAFLAGLLALKWLSRWLEGGRWYLFGIYCLIAAGAVAVLHHAGY